MAVLLVEFLEASPVSFPPRYSNNQRGDADYEITTTGKVMGLTAGVGAPTLIYVRRGVSNKALALKVIGSAPAGFFTGLGATILCGYGVYNLFEEVESIAPDYLSIPD